MQKYTSNDRYYNEKYKQMKTVYTEKELMALLIWSIGLFMTTQATIKPG